MRKRNTAIGIICLLALATGITMAALIFTGAFEIVTRKPEIRVYSGTSEKQYDGIPLENATWYVDEGALGEDQRLEVEIEARITEPGKVINTIKSIKLFEGKRDVSKYYKLTPVEGILTVTPRYVRISTDSVTRVYDGTPLSTEPSAGMVLGGSLVEGDVTEIITNASQTEVGSVDNTADSVKIMRNGKDVSEYYDILVSYGSLTVTMREIAIRSGSATKTYDGSPLVCTEYELASGSFAAGHSPDITYLLYAASYTPPTSVGSYQNRITAKILDANGTDVSRNYYITYSYGTLVIK